MTWNCRILEFADHRALHEVHYDAEGSGPVAADARGWQNP